MISNERSGGPETRPDPKECAASDATRQKVPALAFGTLGYLDRMVRNSLRPCGRQRPSLLASFAHKGDGERENCKELSRLVSNFEHVLAEVLSSTACVCLHFYGRARGIFVSSFQGRKNKALIVAFQLTTISVVEENRGICALSLCPPAFPVEEQFQSVG